MLILLSPAKTMDFSPHGLEESSVSDFLNMSGELISNLQKKTPEDLSALMGISPKIAALNVDRFHSYKAPKRQGPDVKQALYAFKGDVYRDWPLAEYNENDLQFAQNHLRILSGLYGLLRPLDLIRPYRLEMGTPLVTEKGKGLYQFWGSRLTDAINAHMQQMDDPFVVNLASNEYFKALKKKELNVPVVTPVFKDWKNGRYKIISFFAKRARGAMAHHLLKERVSTREALQEFTGLGYTFSPDGSTSDVPLFLRRSDH
jgi:uncharacterized protein